MKRALQVILVLALAGLVFSGTLTYREVFAGATKCPSPGAPGTILGYPACVYGFLMYLAITIVAIVGLRAAPRPQLPPTAQRIGAAAQAQ